MSESESSSRPGPIDLASFADLVVVIDRQTLTIIDVNEHVLSELAWTPEELVGTPVAGFGTGNGPDLDALLSTCASEGSVSFERQLPMAGGGLRQYHFSSRIVQGLRTCLLVGRPIEAFTHARSQLAALQKLADLTDDIFVVSDRVGFVTYANAAAARTHGEQNFVGRHVSEFVHDDDQGLETLSRAVLDGKDRAESRVLAHRGDGTTLTLEVRMIFDRDTDSWFTVERDVTKAVAQERQMDVLAADLHRRATTDELTGVANRAALYQTLAQAIDAGDPFALLLLDMDHFKSVNDSMGHGAGDEFLRCLAHRIESVVQPADLAARLGGDEFVAYLPGLDCGAASDMAATMIDAVGQPYSISDQEITRSCSIGVAMFEAGDDVSSVLRKADRAAYRAKHEGRNRFAVFR